MQATPSSAKAVATVESTGGTGTTPAYRKVQHLSFNAITAAHVHQPSVYHLTTGAITSIDYSYDLIDFSLQQGFAVAYRLLLLQDGTYYTGPTDSISSDTWTSFSVRLLRANFTKVQGDGPDLPDFSCSGAPITLGYLTANSTQQPTDPTGNTASGLDNWNVTVNSAPCPTPPPVVSPCCLHHHPVPAERCRHRRHSHRRTSSREQPTFRHLERRWQWESVQWCAEFLYSEGRADAGEPLVSGQHRHLSQ